MKITPLAEFSPQVACDALVVGVYANGSLAPPAAAVNEAMGGTIARLIEAKECTGKANEIVTLLAPAGVKAGQVVLVGLGDEAACDAGAAFRAAASAARSVSGKSRAFVVAAFDAAWPAEKVAAGVAGAMAGCHGQDLYRAEKKRFPFGELAWLSNNKAAVAQGEIIGQAVNTTRRLVNEPPQEIYPASFAAFAERAANEAGLACEVWDEKRLEQERCGSLLAVGRGSARPPRLVILRHRGAAADAPTLALVGKGVTFDSGGLSLKPSDSMLTMKMDMAGAASVVGTMQAIARLKLPVNVVGLVGLVENMPGGNAFKLGDVLTARNGKTIEVHNTDAEGRLVLADVLCVAVDSGAVKIVDLATLTGSCVVALGNDVVGLMTNDDAWGHAVLDAASTAGERVWQLPMFPEYAEQIRGEVADIKNVGDGRWGGAITAAKFLEEFVAGKPWVHLDIAGPAYAEKPKPWQDCGATGVMVRTLLELAANWK